MRDSRKEFLALLTFFVVLVLLLTNGFAGRIFAKGNEADVYQKIEPVGEVLAEIMRNYVGEPNLDKVVEGALMGMMNSLDRHSAYISPESLVEMTEDTEGEFEGIGVSIKLDNEKNIVIFDTIPNSPAVKAGLRAGDIMLEIDGTSAIGITLSEAAHRIKGRRGTLVHLKVLRMRGKLGEPGAGEVLSVDVKRGTISVESISEARILKNGIAYVRISDFKKNTASEIARKVGEFQKQGIKSLILDLRWNPGGLLGASKEVCELFLPKNRLVTYTKGRSTGVGNPTEDLRHSTEKEPILPPNMPMMVLVGEYTASSAEIVTGALQYWARAIVVGEKTFGKGSVQTIIPLRRPEKSALRLTTALYYTPAEVTIDHGGIKPDVEVAVDTKDEIKLLEQLHDSYADDPKNRNRQNHGSVTGNPMEEGTVEDLPLKRAVEILSEDAVFENLLVRYHKDPRETQVAATQAPAR